MCLHVHLVKRSQLLPGRDVQPLSRSLKYANGWIRPCTHLSHHINTRKTSLFADLRIHAYMYPRIDVDQCMDGIRLQRRRWQACVRWMLRYEVYVHRVPTPPPPPLCFFLLRGDEAEALRSLVFFRFLEGGGGKSTSASFLCVCMHRQPLHNLGMIFWRGVSWLMRPGSTYEAAGRYIIDHFVLPHLEEWSEKFDMALLMYKKLRLLKRGKIAVSKTNKKAFFSDKTLQTSLFPRSRPVLASRPFVHPYRVRTSPRDR